MQHNLKIAFIGQPEYNAPLYETDLDDLYEIRRFPIVFNSMQGDLATVPNPGNLTDFAPDIAVFFRPDYINEDLLRRISGLKIGISTEPYPKYISGVFHYTSDSIKRLKLLTRVAVHQFDYLFHYDQASLGFLELMGLRMSDHFVPPVATGVWRPAEQTSHTRDLTFIGRSTEHRERHFGALKRDCNFLHIAHGIVGQEALGYYHSAPIGLNVHAEPELSWEPRVQQLMACGLIVVSEPISPNNIFTSDEHFLETKDPSQTYEICREILAQPAKYETVRRAGYKKVLDELSARQVWPRLFERCMNRDFPRPAFDLSRFRIAPFEICAEYNGFEHLLDPFRGDHA
jgi:Glycosyl transferases group 1